MGFRLRKSYTLGGVKITTSKSGISYSVGGNGYRVTKKANGNTQSTISIPGTGVFYTEENCNNQHAFVQSKTRKKCIIVIFASLILLLGIIFLCVLCRPKQQEPSQNWLNDFAYQEMPTFKSELTNLGYDTKITGILINKSGKDLSFVEITFSLFDKQGNLIGVASDSTHYFANNGTWEFSANPLGWYSSETSTARCTNIRYW